MNIIVAFETKYIGFIVTITAVLQFFVSISKCFLSIYRIFSNKRPLSFKHPSPINVQYDPKNIL